MSSKNNNQQKTSHKNRATFVMPEPPPFVFDDYLSYFSVLSISSILVSDILEHVHFLHLMNLALLKWPEYAVERIILDMKITTLSYMRAPDRTPMPIFDDELQEPVRL
jgi:hypothetical protein